ncbi:MAG: DMT family transporter, partial [Gemmatimonadetes bacterium]|nr:DMT family transporter [Gemmatimonadota bacterium]
AGPLFAAQTGCIVTASGVFWGIIILAEEHSAWVWAALAVIFAGVTLVNPRSPHDDREAPDDREESVGEGGEAR